MARVCDGFAEFFVGSFLIKTKPEKQVSPQSLVKPWALHSDHFLSNLNPTEILILKGDTVLS